MKFVSDDELVNERNKGLFIVHKFPETKVKEPPIATHSFNVRGRPLKAIVRYLYL
jgi:hypothetical protein